MPVIGTKAAASAQGFGFTLGGAEPVYIESIFSTWLYTGNGGTNGISNGIDLTKGGLVWIKNRGSAQNHVLTDTARGDNSYLSSNTTTAATSGGGVYLGDGFAAIGSSALTNASGNTYASWTFREQPKFFDVVTYTGTGSARTVAHNLDSVPGCIIVKSTSSTGSWVVYHRGVNGGTNPQNFAMTLNATAEQASLTQFWNNTAPTSTVFTVGAAGGETNETGVTYVAYLFAHNAGGFGLTGTDNVISCGSYTGNGSTTGPTVNLGYEPQWILLKNATTGTTEWVLLDNMRGMAVTGNSQYLRPNSSGAESGFENFLAPTATGFQVNSNDSWINSSGNTYIYIAIRRGPMKVPTTGTSVFDVDTQTGAGTSAGQTITTNFPVDLEISMGRNVAYGNAFIDRLRGGQNYLQSQNTDAEVNFTSWTPLIGFANNTGITDANYGSTSASYVAWNFRRAPSVFDEVCYQGDNDTGRNITHNLRVTPELIICKNRTTTHGWGVFFNSGSQIQLPLNLTNAGITSLVGVIPYSATSSTFRVDGGTDVTFGSTTFSANVSGNNYVAYLFASCPGVSKVGSYTGNGSSQTINCGFTGGARFVMIKRTDSTGDWYVWDTARGMVAGTDPYLLLNSATAESNINLVYTTSVGFEIVSSASAVNASGGTYIFLAIA